MVEFRKRKKTTPASPAQRNQAFPLIPHGDKRNLPKSLQVVSLSDIPDYWEKRRRAKMTEEEQEEEAIIDDAIKEEIEEQLAMQRNKNLLTRLGEALDKMQKRDQLKKALEEAKAENEAHAEEGDGYEDARERLQKKIDARNANEVMG